MQMLLTWIYIHVVISLGAETIYLPRTDPDLGRLLIVCVFGNHENRTESTSREKRKKKKKASFQTRTE